MAEVTITVDVDNEIATLEFVDVAGNVTAQPEGSVVTFTTSNEAALGVAPRADNPLVADLISNDDGDAEIGATVTDADGNPLKDTQGNDWAPLGSSVVHVTAGAAQGARLAVSGPDDSDPST